MTHSAVSDHPGSPVDMRLVITDMDGTLLAPDGAIPDAFWPLLTELDRRGIVFAVASGRQYETLRGLFGPASARIAFVAENGAHVVRAGGEVRVAALPRDVADRLVDSVRELSTQRDIGLVWCGRHSAYIERGDEAFVREAAVFYDRLERVDDLHEVTDVPLKFAAFDAGGADVAAPFFEEACRPCRVVASSGCWLDIMDPDQNKGLAVRALKDDLGVTADQVVAFGDYLNDLEMLAEATHSYAMGNAHAEVRRLARYVAPPNHEYGVLSTIADLLERLPRDPVPA
jgi:Cof subfamily protein (haloacid dehalogenase superfamily)